MIIISDNQDITREGLHSYLNSIYDGNIIDISDKYSLIRELSKFENRIVILDYTLFDIRTVEELLVLQSRFPTTSWVIFSSELSENLIRRMSIEPNTSILLKDNSKEEIIHCLLSVLKGRKYICSQLSEFLKTSEKRDAKSLLTYAEIEILRLIVKGLSVKEMASERFLSVHTVTTHKKNIFRKLGVNNVYEATKYALRSGIVQLDDYYI